MSVPSLRAAWRVLRTEGLRATADRVADRRAEARRHRSFVPAPPDWRPPSPIPVLRLAATPPAPRLGGVQTQLLARLTEEAKAGPVALLFPDRSGWRLEMEMEIEMETGGGRRSLRFPGSVPTAVALEDAALEAAVRAAAAVTGARALHVEGLAGLPLGSLRRLGSDLRLILSLHDFAAFCPRPNLLERPERRFCGYCRDLDRCGRCLERSWPVDGAFQRDRRDLAAALLAEAEALIFPSDFLRRTYRGLFPGLPDDRSRVIAPASGRSAPLPPVSPYPPRPQTPLRHVALVGGVQAHKGAAVFAETVRLLADTGLRWSAYGGGGGNGALLGELRSLPDVRLRGYYRDRALPGLLRRDGVDLALLLSIVPESYSLALGECVQAGVPVLAFNLGALGDRVPALGAGRLIPLEAGAEGVAAAIRTLLREGSVLKVQATAAAQIPDAAAAAAAHRSLYEEMRLTGP